MRFEVWNFDGVGDDEATLAKLRWLGEVGSSLKIYDGLEEVVMLRWRSGGEIHYMH